MTVLSGHNPKLAVRRFAMRNCDKTDKVDKMNDGVLFHLDDPAISCGVASPRTHLSRLTI